MRVLVLAAAVLGCASAAWAASPPHPTVSTGIELFGGPARAQEVSGRPLGTNLALFGTGPAARLPSPPGMMRPLSYVAAHMRGTPGSLVPSETRRVVTPIGFVYLVPTTQGWLCVQGPTFATCHRGLLRQGVTWSFYTVADGLDVIGIAANDVRAIDLTWKGSSRHAQLARNVFYVHRPLSITSMTHLPAFGRLAVTYRGHKAATTVSLR